MGNLSTQTPVCFNIKMFDSKMRSEKEPMDSPSEQETALALQVLVALARCTHSVMKYCITDILRYDLKISEFEVLELLYHKGPTSQGEIAERVLLTMGSITYVVDQLVKKGLVRRFTCPENRRVVYAEITEEGRQKMAAIFPPHSVEVWRAVSGLSPEEQAQALSLLEKMGLAASALMEESKISDSAPKAERLPLKNKVNLR